MLCQGAQLRVLRATTYSESIGTSVWDPLVEVSVTLDTAPFAIAAGWVT